MRQISNSSELKTCEIEGEEYVILELDSENISKIPLQIIYYKEYGHKNFLISYNLKNIELSVTKVLTKLKIDYLMKLSNEYGFKFKFEGFPRCLYERMVLKPSLRWYYEDKISFHSNKDCSKKGKIKLDDCELCLFNKKCKGICEEYINKFTEKEFVSLIANKELYDLNVVELETFSNKELIKIGKTLLKDYKKDNFYQRKRFMYVSSFPRNLEDSSKERFMYYIYNRKEDFDKTFDLISKYFDNDFLNSIKIYLEIANQLVLSFGLMGDDKFRKTLYFSIQDLNLEQINAISKQLNLDIKHNSPAGIGIDFRDDNVSFKVYYSQSKISVMDLKSFVKDIMLENKRSFLKFSNSLIKPLNNVLLDYKYKNGELYSKRVDVSMHHNVYRLNQFYALFQISLSFFEGKDLQTLSFEMKNAAPEKINFYYTLTLPEDDEEMDEGEF